MSGHLEKLEHCPECSGELTQAGYDAQACVCGWGPFGVPSARRAWAEGRSAAHAAALRRLRALANAAGDFVAVEALDAALRDMDA